MKPRLGARLNGLFVVVWILVVIGIYREHNRRKLQSHHCQKNGETA